MFPSQKLFEFGNVAVKWVLTGLMATMAVTAVNSCAKITGMLVEDTTNLNGCKNGSSAVDHTVLNKLDPYGSPKLN